MTKLSKLSLCLFFVLSIILSTQTMARTTSAVGVSHLTSSSGGLSAGGSGLQPNEFTGSAMYNIRIPVPPARGGIEPKILLTYDSARKNHNSIMGYGWNLDLGSIERLPGSFGNTNYYAGQHFRVRFAGQTETLTLVDENIDVASLYGLSFATGTRVDEYRATSQSAYNIYLHLRDTTDITDIVDMGWVVIDKNGRTYRFGEDSDSRYESQHTSIDDPIDVFSMNMQTWVSKWVLNSITDANGNQVTVRYGLYQLPSYISYQNIKIFFNFKSFTGGGLPYFPTFRDGYLNADHLIQQLEQVEIRDGLTVLQTFDFTYEQDAWNRHQKLSRIEHTGADGTTLPETEFEYYEQDDLEWSSASQIFTGTTTFWGVEQTGYDDSYLKFADMNGDGLVDKVVAHNYNHLPMLKVYHNNGVDFEDITNRSEWMDSAVSSCTDTFRCYGKLDAFYAHDGQLYQFAHLIDMNGDSLPDRVKANVAFDDGETILGTDMYVWINNGNGFDSPVPWDDPHEGPWAGCSNSERAFIDMNGDGLVDRVIGDPDEGGFWVYYNIGNAFKSTPSFWRDPVEEARGWHPHSGAGKIYEGTEVYNNPETTHTFIRDMNGDGLPDRVFKGTYANEEGEEDDQVAIAIAFNKNGVGWALPEVNDDTIIVDGVDVVSILDPIQDEESRGYISDTADWIDFNGDGFLDRVEGDPDTGVFRVYFFQGMQADEAKLELVGPYTFSDPISDAGVPDDWKGVGYISRGNFDDENINDRIHTFI
ncbi:hypothetical protein KKF63_01710, partial [bacterium]|nr:hypothetical protein [bacterium]